MPRPAKTTINETQVKQFEALGRSGVLITEAIRRMGFNHRNFKEVVFRQQLEGRFREAFNGWPKDTEKQEAPREVIGMRRLSIEQYRKLRPAMWSPEPEVLQWRN